MVLDFSFATSCFRRALPQGPLLPDTSRAISEPKSKTEGAQSMEMTALTNDLLLRNVLLGEGKL